MENSKIAWTDHTFNPWWGCVKVSDGCKNCYAEKFSKRTGNDVWGKDKPRRFFGDNHWKEPIKWNAKAEIDGIRRRVFCASMADVFEDNDALIDARYDLFDLIKATPFLDWLILTKRPGIAYQFFMQRKDLLFDNVWMGVTIESQKYIDRLHLLSGIPAKVKFVSYEPAIGDLVLSGEYGDYTYHWLGYYPRSVNWVICGGESGPGARPFEIEWARSMRDQCQEAGIPFFMKQLGGYPNKRDQMEDFPEDLRIRQFPLEQSND